MKHKAAPPRPEQAPDDSGAGGDDGVQRGPTRVRYAANHEGQLSIDKEIYIMSPHTPGEGSG